MSKDRVGGLFQQISEEKNSKESEGSFWGAIALGGSVIAIFSILTLFAPSLMSDNHSQPVGSDLTVGVGE